MNELIGFRNINSLTDINVLKKELLIFDKIFLVGLQEWREVIDNDINTLEELLTLKGLLPLNDFLIYRAYVAFKQAADLKGNKSTKTEEDQYWENNLNYLIEEGKIIYDTTLIPQEKENFAKIHKEITPILDKGIQNLHTASTSDNFYKLTNLCHDLKTRILTSSAYESKNTLITCESSIYEVKDITKTKAEVYNLILDDFPIIDVNGISWGQIFDFKNDPEVYDSIWSLRNWITNISKSNKSIAEIEEEYRHLKFQYKQAINIHKMKTSNSVFHTTIHTSAELLENLARLKFSKVSDLFFKFKENKILLMETELKSEGNQLSYLFKAKEKFK